MSKKRTILGAVLSERRQTPSLEAVLSGEIPLVAKVRFADGRPELRATTKTRTDLIVATRGDLLLSGINALKGAVALLGDDDPEKLAATIHYSAYQVDADLADPQYIWRYLRSPQFRREAVAQLPNGIKTELRASKLLSLEVELPSLPEQRVVVKRLMTAERALEDMRGVRCRKSSMVLGKRVTVSADARRLLLTRLDQMSAAIAASYNIGTLEDVLVEGLRHGPAFPCAPDADGVTVLMPSSTTGFGIDMTKVQYAVGVPDLKPLDILEPGDIIFARGNKPEQVGNCGLFAGATSETTYANLFMRIRVDSTACLPAFAQYWLMTPLVRAHVSKHTKGTGPSIQKINGKGVRSIPYPLGVPQGLQEWWVAHLDRVRLASSRLEELVEHQAKLIEALAVSTVRESFQSQEMPKRHRDHANNATHTDGNSATLHSRR